MQDAVQTGGNWPIPDLSTLRNTTERCLIFVRDEIANAFRMGYLQGASYGWESALARVSETHEEVTNQRSTLPRPHKRGREDVPWELSSSKELQEGPEIRNKRRRLHNEPPTQQTLYCGEYLDPSEEESERRECERSRSLARNGCWRFEGDVPQRGFDQEEPRIDSKEAQPDRVPVGIVQMEDEMVGYGEEDFDSIWAEWQRENELSSSTPP